MIPGTFSRPDSEAAQAAEGLARIPGVWLMYSSEPATRGQ